MITMCDHYDTTGHPAFKPLCSKGLRAGLACHSIRISCPEYIVNGKAWDRADGGCICTVCGLEYRKHTQVAGYPTFKQLCDSRIVKL